MQFQLQAMNTLRNSDQTLIRSYVNGNETALSTLITRHQSKIFSTIFLLTKDRALAEDIFQDTLIKVINTLRIGRYVEEGKFLPWTLRIAHNLVIDHFRRAKRRPTVTCNDGQSIFDTLSHSEESEEDRVIQVQTNAHIRKLIFRLSEEQREVLIMRHYARLPFKTIAEATDVSINTALGRMRYALNNLRKMMCLN